MTAPTTISTATPTTPGQVALVTGASRGIGRAIAAVLAAQGMQVIGTATTEAGAAAIGAALSAYPGCEGICLNVNDGPALDAAIDAIVKQRGALHVLVNNAGITRDGLAMRMRDEDWDAVLDTNLKAVFHACRTAMRTMMKQRYGRIVNITSVVGASGNGGQANYAAAKAGVAGMTRALARFSPERAIWGRVIREPVFNKAYAETTISARTGVARYRALKRHREVFRLVKDLPWGAALDEPPPEPIEPQT